MHVRVRPTHLYFFDVAHIGAVGDAGCWKAIGLQGDGHRLHLGVQFDAFWSELASPPGLLIATEGQLAVQCVVCVDPD